jgi:reactive intermediate/imine deaminase
MKQAIQTETAPETIGCYSQAIKVDHAIYLSGQIPLNPKTMTIVEGGIKPQITQVFENLKAVALAADYNLNAIAKLTVYLTDIAHLQYVNEIMASYFSKPYPARTSFVVAALPKSAMIEIDAIIATSLKQ